MKYDEKLLSRLVDKQALIIKDNASVDMYFAIPFGDKRRRPISWIDGAVLKRLLTTGAVINKDNDFVVSPSFMKRTIGAQNQSEQTAHAAQHRILKRQDIYNPDGLRRVVSINRSSVFRRLAVHKDGLGQPFLMADEIEAGEKFARDYGRSLMGVVATQNYAEVTSAKGHIDNSAETLSVMALDARREIMDVLKWLGPGLGKTVVALVGRETGLEQLEISQGWPKRSGKTVLKLALARLSEYYGCKTGVRAKRSMRQ